MQSQQSTPVPTESLTYMRRRLTNPEFSTSILADYARTLCDDLAEAFGADNVVTVSEFDQGAFDGAYDPSLPTLAVDVAQSVAGAELVGVAEANAPERALNVLYLLMHEGSVRMESDDDGAPRMTAAEGIMFVSGGLMYGRLPFPVRVDAVQSADTTVLEQCDALGIPTMEDAALMRNGCDKSVLPHMALPPEVLPAQRYARDQVQHELAQGGLVVKPASRMCGLGVKMFDDQTHASELFAYHDYLYEHGYEPLIEERIISWPFVDPTTNERLDWNTRAILAHGKPVGMYVRADIQGGPVNKTISARSLLPEDSVPYFANPETADEVLGKLHRAARMIGLLYPKGHLGLDLTVDESGRVRVYELNVRRIGGLQTITALRTADKLAQAQLLRQQWIDALHRQQQAVATHTNKQAPRSFASSFFGLVVAASNAKPIGLHGRINPVALNDGDVDVAEHVALYDCVAARYLLAFDNRDAYTSRRMGRMLQEHFPLEVTPDLWRIVTMAIDPHEFEPLIDAGERFFPREKAFALARSVIAARSFDLRGVNRAWQAALANGATQEECGRAVAYFLRQPFTQILRNYEGPEREAINNTIDVAMALGIRHGYKGVVQMHALQEAPRRHKRDRVFAAQLRFIMAAGCGEYAAATALVPQLMRMSARDRAATDIFVDAIHKDVLLRSPEGQKLFNEYRARRQSVTERIRSVLSAYLRVAIAR